MAEKNARLVAILAIGGSVIALVFALAITPFLVTTAQQPEDEYRRLVSLESEYDPRSNREVIHVEYVKVGDMQPNSDRWFLDPFGKTMEGSSTLGKAPKPGATINASFWTFNDKFEAFELYTLIRLPAFLGGEENETSAYRAYSAISTTDHCFVRYWPHEGRLRLENPCAGDMYRAWDGVAIAGPAAVGISGGGIISSGLFSALASLDLAVNDEGYITAKRPDTGYSENGMPGEGRKFSLQEMHDSAQKMLAAASKYTGHEVPFPASIFGKYYLSDLRPLGGSGWHGMLQNDSPGALEAVYSSRPSGSEYGEIMMMAYPLDSFPELALNGPAIASSALDPHASDLEAETAKLNWKTVSQLLQVYDADFNDMSIRATAAVGIFAVMFASVETVSEDEVMAGALIWGESADGGNEQLVAVRSVAPLNLEELLELAKTVRVE